MKVEIPAVTIEASILSLKVNRKQSMVPGHLDAPLSSIYAEFFQVDVDIGTGRIISPDRMVDGERHWFIGETDARVTLTLRNDSRDVIWTVTSNSARELSRVILGNNPTSPWLVFTVKAGHILNWRGGERASLVPFFFPDGIVEGEAAPTVTPI